MRTLPAIYKYQANLLFSFSHCDADVTLSSLMSPYFGPLSADCIELRGLTKHEAMRKIRQEIRHAIREIVPPRPEFQLLHKQNHKVTGPWMCLGTEGQLDAGRWYLAVCVFNSPCSFISMIIFLSVIVATPSSTNLLPTALTPISLQESLCWVGFSCYIKKSRPTLRMTISVPSTTGPTRILRLQLLVSLENNVRVVQNHITVDGRCEPGQYIFVGPKSPETAQAIELVPLRG